MKSNMQFQFSMVPTVSVERSVFNRSHGHKTTFDEGYLIPFYVDEALPGDTFKLKTTVFIRLTCPMKYPVMDNMYLEQFFFAVPCRLLWDNWKKFMGERDNPDDSISFTEPVILSPDNGATAFPAGGLADYFGLPLVATDGPSIGEVHLKIRAAFFRAYNQIYKEWFRDQNIIDSPPINKGDGPDQYEDYDLQKIAKYHDYFTSALPWPLKGGVEVDMPLGTSAPVIGTGDTLGLWNGQGSGNRYGGLFDQGSGAIEFDKSVYGDPAGTAATSGPADVTDVSLGLSTVASGSGIIADLSSATAATVNELREAIQLQRMLESEARSGTRYIEIIKGQFGVESPDSRQQRPEFLGSSKVRISVSPVAQTGATSGTDYLGQLAAFATGVDNKGYFTKSFTEHCIVMGLVAVRADLNYQQGINRMFSRRTKHDHYWPKLAHLGEQEVLRKELLAVGAEAEDEIIFGYQERYAEYRYHPSTISGEFRSDGVTVGLDAWHLAQFLAPAPTLSQSFIEETAPMSRIKTLTAQPDFIMDSHLDLVCARPMPVYSVPGLIDHF